MVWKPGDLPVMKPALHEEEFRELPNFQLRRYSFVKTAIFVEKWVTAEGDDSLFSLCLITMLNGSVLLGRIRNDMVRGNDTV